jgi:hypothetical protein
MSITIDQILAYITDLGMIILQVAIILALGIVVGRVGGWIINKVFSRMHTVESFRKSSIGRAILRAGYSRVISCDLLQIRCVHLRFVCGN